MMGTTHQVGGVTFAGIAATSLYLSTPLVQQNPAMTIPVILAGGWLGGLMPDIDHPNSTISRMRVGFPYKLALWLKMPFLAKFRVRLFKPISWLIHFIFGHRGATHTLWLLLLSTLLLFIPSLYLNSDSGARPLYLLFVFGYAIGYFSHLFLDSLTPSGTPMLWPWPDVHLARIPTNKHEGKVKIGLIFISLLIILGMFFLF